MNFKNIDTSGLTPEQIVRAEAMADYTRSQECKNSFRIVNLAETLLRHLLESDHRPGPVEAAHIALGYAKALNDAGEAHMQADFETWLAARPTEPAPPLDEVGDLDEHGNPPLGALLDDMAAERETITLDQAKADTEARKEAGEAVDHPEDPS